MKDNIENILKPQIGQPTFGFSSYNLTSKLSSDSMLKLNYNREVVYKKVSFWIQHHPVSIWELLYRGKISLAKDAHQKLMAVVQHRYPELYFKKEVRRLKYKKLAETRML
ncbi:hypothetical protein [Mucilaginibacter panaciglaebae]|uniref:KTSC domain-containing protein n=1 Tax=Mucilaginibacter panaciglaebae TaxID=502331 RepID=A0ABP7WNH9_9SPHI